MSITLDYFLYNNIRHMEYEGSYRLDLLHLRGSGKSMWGNIYLEETARPGFGDPQSPLCTLTTPSSAFISGRKGQYMSSTNKELPQLPLNRLINTTVPIKLHIA